MPAREDQQQNLSSPNPEMTARPRANEATILLILFGVKENDGNHALFGVPFGRSIWHHRRSAN